jgi:hypothetical protein
LEKTTDEDTVKYMNAQTIKLWGHFNRMEKTNSVGKITEWNPIDMRFKGRPKNRQRGEMSNDFKKLKVKNWTYLVRDRKASYELVFASLKMLERIK